MQLLTQETCIKYLEKLRWKGIPTCPYCQSTRSTKYRKELRHRCNDCFTSYSVTVGTLFHRTHISLPTWFKAIYLLTEPLPMISVRKLSKVLGVSKNTAFSIRSRIFQYRKQDPDSLQKISDFYGKYIR
ncbi:MAG: IS1595 family transposase [Cyanobacteria bacterium J06639_14]